MTSPLPLFLSGQDPASPATDPPGAGLYRLGHDAVLAVALAAIVRRRRAAGRLARAGWPLLLFAGYAAASLAWSSDPQASLKALLNGLPLLAAAAALPLALTPGDAASALLRMLALSAIGSVLAALLLPRFGVTGAGDLVGAGPAGAWRGLYLHKNMLGHTCGLAAAVLCGRSGRLVRPRALRVAGAAAALGCLLLARSASGLAIAAALPLLERLCRPQGRWRTALAGFGAAALALACALWPTLEATALAVLGRDESLSGRTAIWQAAQAVARDRPLSGSGLDVSTSPEVSARLQGLFGVDHVHSAALDLDLNLGALGVGFAALALAGGLRAALQPPPRGARAARSALLLLVAGWILSGLTEDMGVRLAGPMAAIGAAALCSLYALQTQRRRPVRRPAWRFPSAGRARLGRARLEAAG